ncbi:MAG: metallophosphoesterase [Planctomycetes bacterium]|nr:metallophosphoesterase [Planctomycetota bacterium]
MHAPLANSVRLAPRRHSALRLLAFRAAEWSVAACGGRRIYQARHLTAKGVRVREERVLVPDLAPGLEGLSIAQLSDLHGGRFLGRGDLRGVVERVNALAPDLVVVTGDWITHAWSEALPLLDDLAELRAPLGCFAVFGNHDYKGRLEGRIADAARARGVRFLRNQHARLERRGSTFVLTGLEDPEEARAVDLEEARAGVDPRDLEIVLCHNPLAAPRIARVGCALILAGHSHGTQVDLPFLRRLGPAHPGLRLRFGRTTLLVSRGLGVVGVPWRVGAPAEVVLARFERGVEAVSGANGGVACTAR